MKLSASRYLLLVAFSLLLGACQSTPSATTAATDARATAIAQLEQNLASSELATAEDQLATLQAQSPDDPSLVHYQRQLAEAYLRRSQIVLQKGDVNAAATALARARDDGAAAVCAEAVGAMRRVLADTVDYCRQRQQFGQPIGSFQVLQHRMVDMSMELEQAVSAVYLAVLNLDAEPDVRARAVSAAKATVGRAARFIGQQAVQLHGGMGMTEELAIGHYFKRLTAMQYEFGSTDFHRTRYARLTRPAGS